MENIDVRIEDIQRECANFLLKYEWVKNTYTATQLHENEYSNSFYALIQRGYNQKRSGDVIVSLQTGWLKSHWESGGTTHGSSYSYDTHVPLIFWGGKIPKGKTDRKVNIRDIAPIKTEKIHSKEITEILGIARGSTVRARNVARDIFAGIKNLVGGEIEEYTKLQAYAREQAVERMVEDAKNLGADAVINVRMTTSVVMQGACEILAYGTAVKISD
mgnify:CR=1 FL=1